MNHYLKIYSYDPIPIGQGSFSLVYKGINQLTDELVAIKKINITFNKDLSKDRIDHEVKIMKSLDHPNIVKFYDVIHDGYNNINLVMEYCEVGDLALFLDHKPLKEKYVKELMTQIKDAVEYLYHKNIIHRDIKPQNILLKNNKIIKLTDFGFAKSFKSNEKKLSNTICGSPIYMAPEIIKASFYNEKSDLWSIGIILYEMIVGVPPYKANNHLELIQKINNNPIYLPSSILISENCRSLINDLLQKDPDDRIDYESFFKNKWFICYNEEDIGDMNLLDFVEDFDYHGDDGDDSFDKKENINEIRMPIDNKHTPFGKKSEPISIKKSSSEEDFKNSFVSPIFNTPIMFTPSSNNGYVIVKSDKKKNKRKSKKKNNDKTNDKINDKETIFDNLDSDRTITESFIQYMSNTVNYFRSYY